MAETDPHDRRLALRATGLLRELNDAGVLGAADVHVATRLGRLGQEGDERVLLAAALAVRAVRAGSVCLDLRTVAEAVAGDRTEQGAPLPWPDLAAWERAVQDSALVGAGVLRWHDGAVYLDRYWRQESQVVDDLRSRAAGARPTVDEAALADALAAYFPDDGYADQRAAAETACRHWTSVVTGGPGTGKTTTVARLIGVLMALQPDAVSASEDSGAGLRVALAAPTGKAAARMAQAVRAVTLQPGFPGVDAAAGDPTHERRNGIQQLEAVTLHRLLGSRPDNRTRFRHHRGNRLPHDVVIVDETSMVSLTMMARLLEAVRPEARLVLVGDADQLASVDAGAVLKDLVDGYDRAAADSPVSRLGPTRRFGERIGELATAVRDGDVEATLAVLRGGSAEVVWLPEDELPALLQQHALALHDAAASADAGAALRAFEQHRLLCAHRDGPYGVAWWNRTVERLLMAGTGREWLPEWYVGQPIIVNANDYGLGLFNGDTGVICAGVRPEDRVAVIDDGAGAAGRRLPTTRLADVSTAHAMTVHRSQGSQFDEVTVLLPEPDSRVLTRELFYTAVTRARSVVRVVGSEDAVRAAVTRRARRATGLAGRLAAVDRQVNDR